MRLVILLLFTINLYGQGIYYFDDTGRTDYAYTHANLQTAVAAGAARHAVNCSDDIYIYLDHRNNASSLTSAGSLTLTAKSPQFNLTTRLPVARNLRCNKRLIIDIWDTSCLTKDVRIDHTNSTITNCLAKITTTGAAGPVIRTLANESSGYYSLKRLNIEVPAGATDSFVSAVQLNNLTGQDARLAAHHIEFDQVWIHGQDDGAAPTHGIYMGGAENVVFRNGAITEIHEWNSVYANMGDAQAIICGGAGQCQLSVINSYIEAAGEMFMTGGGAPDVRRAQIGARLLGNSWVRPIKWKHTSSTSDAPATCTGWNDSIHRNTASNEWWLCVAGSFVSQGTYASTSSTDGPRKHYIIKPTIEIKTIAGMRIEGNKMQYGWLPMKWDGTADQQEHNFLLINRSSQSDAAGHRYTPAKGITVKYNLMQQGYAAFSLSCSLECTEYLDKINHVNISHNIVTNLNTPDPSNPTSDTNPNRGRSIALAQITRNIIYDHNTVYLGDSGTGNRFATAPSTQTSDGMLSITNNLAPLGSTGVTGMSAPYNTNGGWMLCHMGLADSLFTIMMSKNIFTRETALGATAVSTWCDAGARWPANSVLATSGTGSPTSWQTYFNADHTVVAAGSADGTATDGSNVGADVNLVTWNTEHTTAGTHNTYLFNFHVKDVYNGALDFTFVAPSANNCAVVVDKTRSYASPDFSGNTTGSTRNKSISVATMNLASGHYYGKVTCDSKYKLFDIFVD